jgi:hypothetical protein
MNLACRSLIGIFLLNHPVELLFFCTCRDHSGWNQDYTNDLPSFSWWHLSQLLCLLVGRLHSSLKTGGKTHLSMRCNLMYGTCNFLWIVNATFTELFLQKQSICCVNQFALKNTVKKNWFGERCFFIEKFWKWLNWKTNGTIRKCSSRDFQSYILITLIL